MLIILPPSESKRLPPDDEPPVDVARLSFPELMPLRTRILDALEATSARPDALRRLHVGPAQEEEVARNTAVRRSPTRPVLEVYAGALHAALDAPSLSSAAGARAADRLVIVSSLWGALRPADRIPAYRLHVCSRLVGVDRLERAWRTVLPVVLAGAAGGKEIVLDLRSPSYQAVGMPAGLADRTVVTRVVRDGAGARALGGVDAKRARGALARELLESGIEPAGPEALAAALLERRKVGIEAPVRPGRPWTLTIAARVDDERAGERRSLVTSSSGRG